MGLERTILIVHLTIQVLPREVAIPDLYLDRDLDLYLDRDLDLCLDLALLS